MYNNLIEEQAVKIASFKGIDVYRIDAKKFKTTSINIFFIDNLSKESATKNALLPAVLRRGCEGFPAFKDIALYLEGLYGASFDCGAAKKGEKHIIQFYADNIADQYAGKGENLFEKIFELLLDIIYKPVLEGSVFKEDYVWQEKENLRRIIESRVNDKVQYSIERCFEEMCRDEPFGIYEYGFAADIKQITPAGLFEHYKAFLRTLPIKVFIAGNMEDNKMEKMIERLKQVERGGIKPLGAANIYKKPAKIKNVTENMDVNQGKLCIGLRTNTAPEEKDYYKLLVYNGILGDGIHSKLFQNVREKHSLAYYIFSQLEKFKGLMVIGSGIETDARDKAVKIIMEQLYEIEQGNISDYEYESTIKAIETGIRSLKDSQFKMVDFYLSQIIANSGDTFETLIEKVKKISKEDVVGVAEKVKPDTIYFMTSKEKTAL